MSDVVVRSSFPREETVKRLMHIFGKGNDLSVEMNVLHGEFYLSPAPETHMGPIPGMNRRNSLDPFSMQFRVKAQMGEGKETSTIHITPQSKAFSIVLCAMFLTLAWIFIIVISLAEKKWLEKEVYLGGVLFTLLMVMYFKSSGSKEKKVIERIVREFEGEPSYS